MYDGAVFVNLTRKTKGDNCLSLSASKHYFINNFELDFYVNLVYFSKSMLKTIEKAYCFN